MLHFVIGVATVGLVLVLGRWWGLGTAVRRLAALLVACDPILLSQSAQVMTETPATFLATAGLVVLTWASWNVVGFSCDVGRRHVGPGALCRPTLLLWTIAAGIALCLRAWTAETNNTNSRGLTAPGAMATNSVFPRRSLSGAAIVLSPWAIRNRLQLGQPIVATTHGGYTLLLANNPEFYQWLRSGPWGSVWRADRFNADWDQRKPHDELQADRLAYAEAGRPFAASRACSPEPVWCVSAASGRRCHTRLLPTKRRCAVYRDTPWACGTCWSFCWRRWAFGISLGVRDGGRGPGEAMSLLLRPPPSAFRLLQPGSGACCWSAVPTSVHAVFWTDMRMRATVMPVVALAAAAGAFGHKRST